MAKKGLAGKEGVCDLNAMPAAERIRLLEHIPAAEVWGVGPRISARLEAAGVRSVLQLQETDPAWVRSEFSVVLERTVRELRGLPCLELEDMAPAKKQIIASRSFGSPIMDLDELSEAISSHTTRAAEKLRAQSSVAGLIAVFIHSNRFREDQPQYHRQVVLPLSEPTDDTRKLVGAARAGLKQIFRPGIIYKKAGIMLGSIHQRHLNQPDLFSAGSARQERSEALMRTMDAINSRWGRGTLQPLAAGLQPAWRMRRELLSPAWTTRWDQLPTVRAQ